MTSNAPDLPHIPAQRYFTLNELCALVEISPEQFAQWQHAHGVVVGYGGDHYTRQDVMKLRRLKDTFAPLWMNLPAMRWTARAIRPSAQMKCGWSCKKYWQISKKHLPTDFSAAIIFFFFESECGAVW